MPNRFGLLSTSLKAMNAAGFMGNLLRRRIPFFLNRSPVVPLRMASTGVYFLTFPVQLKQKSSVTATTSTEHKPLTRTPPTASITIVSDTLRSIISPKGILAKKPMMAPTRASTAYLTMYSPRIVTFGIPIAFITPIWRNSSVRVKLIVKRSITNATTIKQTLTASRIPAMIMSMM